jgi:hypothetical protein
MQELMPLYPWKRIEMSMIAADRYLVCDEVIGSWVEVSDGDEEAL